MSSEMKQNLLLLPKKIFDKEKQIMDGEDLLSENKLMIEIAKITLMEEIESERKKAKEEEKEDPFSNQSKREWECERRAKEKYEQVIKANKDVGRQLKIDKAELSFLKRKFRAYESISRLGGN